MKSFLLSLAVAVLVVSAVWAATPSTPTKGDKPGQEFPSQGNAHIQRLGDPHEAYNSDPPTSGTHMPGIAPWGMYNQPIPKEFQVHNLEDGGVLIQYACPKGCPEITKKLETLFQKYKKRAETEPKYKHLIIAPYPQMDSRLALSAWTRLDKLNDFDESRIDRFVDAYIGIDHHKK